MDNSLKTGTIRVCTGKACTEHGGAKITEALVVKAREIRKTTGAEVDLAPCACVGYCEKAPTVLVDDRILITNADPATVWDKVERRDGQDIRKMSLDELTKDDFLGDLF